MWNIQYNSIYLDAWMVVSLHHEPVNKINALIHHPAEELVMMVIKTFFVVVIT